MGISPRLWRVLRVGPIVAVVGLVVFTAHLGVGLGGSRTDGVFNDFVYNGLELLAAAACLARAVLVREERLRWSASRSSTGPRATRRRWRRTWPTRSGTSPCS